MLSHSAISGRARATLPDSSGFAGGLNIQRNPSRSYYTQRKENVFDTTMMQELLDSSGDRQKDAISHYARGVNPMVSISYQNHGNGTNTPLNGGQQARPPIAFKDRIGDRQARTPVMEALRDFEPLSRRGVSKVWNETRDVLPNHNLQLVRSEQREEFGEESTYNPLLVSSRPTEEGFKWVPLKENLKFKENVLDLDDVIRRSQGKAVSLQKTIGRQEYVEPVGGIDRERFVASGRTGKFDSMRRDNRFVQSTEGNVQDRVRASGRSNRKVGFSVSTERVFGDSENTNRGAQRILRPNHQELVKSHRTIETGRTKGHTWMDTNPEQQIVHNPTRAQGQTHRTPRFHQKVVDTQVKEMERNTPQTSMMKMNRKTQGDTRKSTVERRVNGFGSHGSFRGGGMMRRLNESSSARTGNAISGSLKGLRKEYSRSGGVSAVPYSKGSTEKSQLHDKIFEMQRHRTTHNMANYRVNKAGGR